MAARRSAHPGLVIVWTVLLLLVIGLGFGQVAQTVFKVELLIFRPFALGLAQAEDGEAKKDDADKGDVKDEGEAGGDEDESPLEPCEDKRAKALAAEVKKISKKKNATLVLPVLEKIEDLAHKEFEKPLLKLLKHPSSLVAMKAAEMWEWRNHKKVAKKVWSATFGDRKVNKQRFAVNAAVLKSWPRAGLTISDKDFRDIKGAWRWIVGNPNPANAPALTAIAEYVELARDKRLCRQLAEELDEPGTNVSANDPANPPKAWWERRWKLWKAAKPAVVSALMELTGKEFDKTAEAKKWFEDNRKTFGFDW